MPDRLPGACTTPGCPNLSEGGACPACKKKQSRQYDRDRAQDPFHKIYSTARWKKLRRIKLAANPICERCELKPAKDVHHKEEIKEGGDPFEYGNLEALCHRCHSREGAERGRRWGCRGPAAVPAG